MLHALLKVYMEAFEQAWFRERLRAGSEAEAQPWLKDKPHQGAQTEQGSNLGQESERVATTSPNRHVL